MSGVYARASGNQSAELLYTSCTSEIAHNFASHDTNLSFAAGTLTAILGLLGAGEVIGAHSIGRHSHLFPSTSSITLFVLCASFPLLFRFFMRAMIAYHNIKRFNRLQRTAWDRLTGITSERAFLAVVRQDWASWSGMESFRYLAWRNLKFGFMWVLCLDAAAIDFGFWTCPYAEARLWGLGILGTGVLWEALILRNYVKNHCKGWN